jgi:membrane protein implicated in regulation of membrane protease activity
MTTPKLKESSSTALLGLTALCLAPGLLILSPDGRLVFLALAGLVSAVVLFAAPSGKKRLLAGIALLIAIVMAVQAWPEYRAHADARKKQMSLPVSR